MTDWPFGDMRPLSYDLIMADPPWLFSLRSAKGEAKSAQAQYSCMSLADIKALPVGHLAAPNCLLWLWATNPMLDQAFEVISAWGFKFKTAGHWSKKTVNGKQAFGGGYILRCAGEPFLIASNGEPQTANNVRGLIEGVIREHSRKPEEAYAAAELLIPNARRADLFSRQKRAGWNNWGDQSSLFDPTPQLLPTRVNCD
jgi:N6-adenosine-specific RNA methylase IME4